MYRPGKSGKPAEIWGVPEVQEKFEVEHPDQVIDILGMWEIQQIIFLGYLE